MPSSDDESFRQLLTKLEVLGDDALEKAVATQKEKESQGEEVPLAAVIVQSGFLPYGLVERIIAHHTDRVINCEGCGAESKAGSLDPRVPFKCPACDQPIIPSQAPTDLSILATRIQDGAVPGGEEDLRGQTLGGCKLERKIGEGGMGAVYEATQLFLKRKVAVKILPEHHVRRAGFVDRFLRESRLAAQVIHPNVVQVMDAGREGDTYYIIMEFCEGKSLYDILKEEGSVDVYRGLEYVKQSALGLGAGAKHGIIHRDIKPDNIRITPDGIAKVADFGLAKGEEVSERLTMTGAVLGTPLYMSPEQALGDPVDFRTDIYSLGATLYHLISGQPPFKGGSAVSILQKHTSEDPSPLTSTHAGCPPEVEDLIFRMMAKRPSERFNTYDELTEAIDDIVKRKVSERETIASPTAVVAIRKKKKTPIVPIAIIGVVLVLAAAGIWALTGSDPAPPPPASIRIDTTPSGARVFLGGVDIGTTPLRKGDLEPGSVTIRVELEGFGVQEETVELASGETLAMPIDLVALPARLVITTVPEGARATLGGKDVGTTPIDIGDLPAGEVVLGLELAEHESLGETLDLVAGETLERTIEMKPLPGKIRISTGSVSGATVLIDGVAAGKTPLDIPDATPGEIDIRVELEGYEPASRKVTVRAGKNPDVTVALEPLPASVHIETTPPGARILIDGKNAGVSPLIREGLSPGKHRFEARLALHTSKEWEMDLAPGEKGSRSVTLTRPPEVVKFLAGIQEVDSHLQKGWPLRAWDLLDVILKETGFPDGLSQDEMDGARLLQSQVAKKAPRINMSLRFEGKEGLVIRALPRLGGDPSPAPPAGDELYSVEIESQGKKPLTICLVQFAVGDGESFRFLPDEGRERDPGAPVPKLQGSWSSKYQREAGDVFLFLLIATPAGLTLGDVDEAKGMAAAKETVPDVLEAMEFWLEERGEDFALRVIGIDERESKP